MGKKVYTPRKGSIAYYVLKYLAEHKRATKHELWYNFTPTVNGWMYITSVIYKLKENGLVRYYRGRRLKKRGPKEVQIVEITKKGLELARSI